MADTKISALTDGTAVAAGDIVPVVRAGANYRVPLGTAAGSAATAFTSSTVVPSTAPTNGQLLIGHTVNGSYSLATLTQGAGVTITNGAGTITIAASGSSTWDTIGAAAADGSTNNGTNRIVYNTAPTADSRIAWRFSESTAASGGTSTSGVPNQVLLQLDTLASSTQSPLKVLSRGSFVFAVSPTTAQTFFPLGTASAPPIASVVNNGLGIFFKSSSARGIYFSEVGGVTIGCFTADLSGANQIQMGDSGYNTNNPMYACGQPSGLTGLAMAHSSPAIGVILNQVEQFKWTSGISQASKASADAVSYALNFRKARGTVASPTVITTGDVLETKSAYAYLGATNTYRETSRYEVTSAGTISDATTGVGSIVTIYGKTQGTDATVQPTVVITGGSTATFKFAGSGMVAANGTVATVLGSVGPTGANTTVQEWLKVDTPNGTRYIPCF